MRAKRLTDAQAAMMALLQTGADAALFTERSAWLIVADGRGRRAYKPVKWQTMQALVRHGMMEDTGSGDRGDRRFGLTEEGREWVRPPKRARKPKVEPAPTAVSREERGQ